MLRLERCVSAYNHTCTWLMILTLNVSVSFTHFPPAHWSFSYGDRSFGVCHLAAVRQQLQWFLMPAKDMLSDRLQGSALWHLLLIVLMRYRDILTYLLTKWGQTLLSSTWDNQGTVKHLRHLCVTCGQSLYTKLSTVYSATCIAWCNSDQ